MSEKTRARLGCLLVVFGLLAGAFLQLAFIAYAPDLWRFAVNSLTGHGL